MKHRRSWVAGLGALVVACSVNAFAAKSLADYSGEEIFARFCASCHGDTAHGNGPVARSLGVMVPDLTKIAQHYGGFPTQLVRDTIDGRGALIAAHGTRIMPVWGYEFWVEAGADAAAQQEMRTTIAKLVDYLRSIQDDKVAFNRD
jgi:mono/diheme cytochrome c family protein